MMFSKLNSALKNRTTLPKTSEEQTKKHFTWDDFSLGVLIIASLLLNGELGTSQKLASVNVLTNGSEVAVQKVDVTEKHSFARAAQYREYISRKSYPPNLYSYGAMWALVNKIKN